MNDNNKYIGLSKIQKELISGFTAGCLTSIVIHPLDLIKLRLQLNATNQSVNYIHILNSIFKSNNKSINNNKDFPIKKIYRGFTINLIGNSLAWSIYFGIYKYSKDILSTNKYVKPNLNDSMIYLLSGAIGGLSTSILTNPIWVIKTRIMSINKNDNLKYNSIISSFKTLIKNEGVSSLWKGLVPALIGVSQGAIYFMIYDNFKSSYLSKNKNNTNNNNNNNNNNNIHYRSSKLKNSQIIFITSISKMISMSIVYPFQLFKSNQQSFEAVNNNKFSLLNLIKFIYRTNGIKGFYQGLFTNLLKAVPSTCITFFIYENVNHLL